MSVFDKLCAGAAFLLGVVLLVLGAVGLFTGCAAHFRLPPVIGVLPAFVGWGIARAVYLAWSLPPEPDRWTPPPPGPGPDHGDVERP